ncbi:hypothetical protein BJG93_25275 [Paraburkholderia sprentiae WSM5005]|uniref:Uncharacterized protein n=1 Tax=Paraburkholderia sprentiae WSM5005 TaxID=754502 RepID=A0A1I9YR05_9BURK|nr:hypothetical protein [Paraburkholderia sprentiae]APA88628.1 hypothetical protein BJG93_25275 [Paraburkholderia sprentiae WSM5005]
MPSTYLSKLRAFRENVVADLEQLAERERGEHFHIRKRQRNGRREFRIDLPFREIGFLNLSIVNAVTTRATEISDPVLAGTSKVRGRRSREVQS